jgi:tRNA(Ile)-lysidine synthase
MTGLPREIRRRLARRAIHAVRLENSIDRPDFADSTNIESLLDALEAGRSATQAAVMASATAAIWHFRAAPPRRSH